MRIGWTGTREAIGTREIVERALRESPWAHVVDAEHHVGDCRTGIDAAVYAAFPNAVVHRCNNAIPWPGKGPERNGRLIASIDGLIAIPGPHSKGTHDAIRQATKRKVPVFIVTALIRDTWDHPTDR